MYRRSSVMAKLLPRNQVTYPEQLLIHQPSLETPRLSAFVDTELMMIYFKIQQLPPPCRCMIAWDSLLG